VDDEAQIRETVPALLEDLGHQVRVAAGGQEALGLLAGDPDLDAVILDLNMPELGGLATLARLRTLRPELPVLVSSGYRDPAAMAVIRGFPRVGILDKPFLAEDLHRALAALAALAGAGRNAEASLEACPPVLAKSRYT
jgi:CheY-like chemotaxis protein